MTSLVVISPDQDLITAWQGGLADTQEPLRLLVLREYPHPEQVLDLLRKCNPRAVAIGLSGLEPALWMLESLRASHPGLPLIATHVENQTNLITAALRSGASAYVGPPFDGPALQAALDQAPAGGSARKAHFIAVAPSEGGSGASATALHLAAALSRLISARVLLLDLDVPCSTLQFRLKMRPAFTLADAVQRAAFLDEVWSQVATKCMGMEVLPAPLLLEGVHLDSRRTLSVVRSAGRVYDSVVVDLPPVLDHPALDVALQADDVLLICTPEPSSLHLARRKIDELRRAGLAEKALRLVLNRADGPGAMGRSEVEETLQLPVTWTLSNDYVAMRQASLTATLIRGDHELARQFRSIARELLGIGPEDEGPADGAKRRSLWSSLAPRRWTQAWSTDLP